MRPAAAIAAFVTAVALLVPASALATARVVAPTPSAVAQLVGSTSLTSSSGTSDTDSPTFGAAPSPTTTLNLGPVNAVNLAADRTALNAYANYLTALVKIFPESQQNDSDYVSTIASDCKSALEPLTQSSQPVTPAMQTTLTTVGEEIGDDLAINFDTTALGPFLKFSQTLQRLRWSRAGRDAAIVKRFNTTQTAVMTLDPSNLCANALLAAVTPQTTPTATKAFVKQYDKAANAANTALANFLDLLRNYQTPTEHALVTKINALATEVTKSTKIELLDSGQTLSTVLETT